MEGNKEEKPSTPAAMEEKGGRGAELVAATAFGAGFKGGGGGCACMKVKRIA